MKNIENSIASFFSNNHRYIKIDGSGFHSGKLKSIFEKANFNVGAMAVIGFLALDYLTQSNLNTVDPDTYKNLLQNSVTFLGLMTFAQRKYLFNALRKNKTEKRQATVIKNHGHKAIDTTGKNLSRANVSETDMHSMQIGKIVSTTAPLLFIPLSYFVFSHLYGMNGFIIHSAMVTATFTSQYNRLNKLQKGHSGENGGYVFCDEPPAKTAKEKKTRLSFGGLTNPAP